MPGLGVNIDHVATIRQARRTIEPDPVWAAVEAQLGGADCITFHLRKDRRHINDRDARLLPSAVQCKLNMEMSLEEEIVRIAVETRPNQATLVPENRQEVTTEGGLDVTAQGPRVAEVAQRLHEAGVIVSAFIDPEASQVRASRQAGCDAIEIHTGAFANAFLAARGPAPRPAGPAAEQLEQSVQRIQSALKAALEMGLTVHGGHGLTYDNVHRIACLGGFTEFNIGHSIISRSVFVGLRQAVTEMKRLIDRAAPPRG